MDDSKGRLQAAVPGAPREIETARARMFGGISFHADGAKTQPAPHQPPLTFARFRGALPRDIRFEDTRASLLDRLGPPRVDSPRTMHWLNDDADRQ